MPPGTAERPRLLVVVAAVFAIVSLLGAWSLVVVPEARTAILNIAITVLGAAIAWGLLTLRAGWRLAALGVLCLGIAALGAGIAMTIGIGPFTLHFVQNDGDAASSSGAVLSVLGTCLALSGWMVWALTRRATRRAFGSRLQAGTTAE